MPTAPDLLATAEAWRAGLGTDSPDQGDVELVVRLNLRDQGAARQLLFARPDALFAHWGDLQGLLDGRAPVAASPEEAVVSTPPVVEPVVVPAPELEAADDTAGLAGVQLARLRAVRAWHVKKSAGQPALAVPDDQLARIAQEDPNDPKLGKRMVSVLTPFAAEIAELMLAAGADVPRPSPEQMTVPNPGLTPVPEPAAASGIPVVTDQSGRPGGQASPNGFAPYVFQIDRPVTDVAKPSFTVSGENQLTVSWPEPPLDGRIRIFRVATGTKFRPDSPDADDIVAVTYSSSYLESRWIAHPTLSVAVWVNEGSDEVSARTAQPTLYAEGAVVLPVRNFEARAEGSTVVGQWEVAPGVRNVTIERVPVREIDQYPDYSPKFEVPAEMVKAGSFKDTGATAGGDFIYRIYALTPLTEGGKDEHSPPVTQAVQLDAALESVDDLDVAVLEDGYLDVSWTQPIAGRVEIYRTVEAPSSGLAGGDAAAGSRLRNRRNLEEGGLVGTFRQIGEVEEPGGRRRTMTDLLWPDEWSRIYFTPVTVIDEERMIVGKTHVRVRAGVIRDVTLIERVDRQFVTLAWPAGAAEVRFYQGAAQTISSDYENSVPLFSLSRSNYRKFGGAHLPKQLPGDGCWLTLVAVTFSGHDAEFSEPVSVEYPGLSRMHYSMQVVEEPGGFLKAAQESTRRTVVVTTESSPQMVPLVLVHHPSRLPLSPRDGDTIAHRTVSFAANVPVPVFEDVDYARYARGYLRLFVQVEPALSKRMAVLDPPLNQLRCAP